MMPMAQTEMASSSGNEAREQELPISDRRERVIAILVFISSFAYLCAFRRYLSLEPDEGIVLQGAERILHGQLPYRDFFTFYTPGSFYLVAFLFRIFGDSFVVARTSLAFSGAVCSLITYVIARRSSPRAIALFAAVLTTIAGIAYRFLVLHNWYSTLFACLAVYAAVRWLESRQSMWVFAMGTLCSMTFLIEQSKGSGLCLGLVLGFAAVCFVDRDRILRGRENIVLSVGALWPFAVTFAYFGAQHATSAMLQDWLWPLHHYTRANHVPYGWQNWSDSAREAIFYSGSFGLRLLKIIAISPGLLVPALPLFASALFVYWILRTRRDHAPSSESQSVLLISGVLCGLLVSVIVVRADIIHFMYLTPFWYILLAWILGSNQLPGKLLSRLRPYVITFVGCAFGLMAFALLLTASGANHRIETRRGVIYTTEKDTVIEYIQSHRSRGEDLIVYPYLPLYNYLTATRSPSGYDYFQPGMNTVQQSKEIIAALESHPGQAVLFEPWFADKFANSWPGTPLAAIANDSVADYIVRNYRVCRPLNSPSNWRFEYRIPVSKACP
jgi:4-amino-4-deoxy-L-arabinose transferase-like glycosyltransferase